MSRNTESWLIILAGILLMAAMTAYCQPPRIAPEPPPATPIVVVLPPAASPTLATPTLVEVTPTTREPVSTPRPTETPTSTPEPTVTPAPPTATIERSPVQRG